MSAISREENTTKTKVNPLCICESQEWGALFCMAHITPEMEARVEAEIKQGIL